MKNFRFTSVDRNNRIPYYLQAKEEILRLIKNGTLKEGDRIDNEFELADKFNVSRTTIRQTMKDLEVEGVVDRIRSKGTFIRKKKIEATLMQEFSFFDKELGRIDIDFKIKILNKKVMTPSEEVQSKLKLNEGKQINFIDYLRMADEETFSYTMAHIPYGRFKDIINENLTNFTTPYLIERKYNVHISKVIRHLEPVGYEFNKDATKYLKIDKKDHYFYLQTFYYDKENLPIAYYEGHFSPKKSNFIFHLER